MKLLFFVLNRVEKLDDILTAFVNNDIKGATVIDSIGMARLLSCKHDDEEISFLSSLRVFLKPEREKSNIILTVIQDSQLNTAVSVIESVVGDLSSEDTGVVFSVPVDFAKGIM